MYGILAANPPAVDTFVIDPLSDDNINFTTSCNRVTPPISRSKMILFVQNILSLCNNTIKKSNLFPVIITLSASSISSVNVLQQVASEILLPFWQVIKGSFVLNLHRLFYRFSRIFVLHHSDRKWIRTERYKFLIPWDRAIARLVSYRSIGLWCYYFDTNT